MMGYFLFAQYTPKRTIAVLNQLGFSVSYNTICNGLNSAVTAGREILMERVNREPILITYDNLTNYSKVGDETLFNKIIMYCFTAAAVIFLTMTKSLAQRLSKSPGVIVDDVLFPEEVHAEEIVAIHSSERMCLGAIIL
jgi:hypothetical protein